MTTLLARAHVELGRLGTAVRRHWMRLAVGAFVGWLVSSFLGAFALVYLEYLQLLTSEATAAFVGVAIVWSGIGLGALAAYAVRPSRAPTPAPAQVAAENEG